ncbi:MAG: hypothetical protein AAFX08_09740 [Pseudomonadota bacterium]
MAKRAGLTIRTTSLAAIAAAALSGLAGGIDANAQSRTRSLDARVVDSMSANEVVAVMRRLRAPSRMTDDVKTQGGVEKTVEATIGGGTVYLFLRDCNGPGAYAQCGEVQPTVFFNADGVTLSKLNEYNLDVFGVSVAGLLPDGRGIIFSHVTLADGVTVGHVRRTIEEFLSDADLLLESINPNGAPGVRLPASALIAPKEFRVNQVGANAPDLSVKVANEFEAESASDAGEEQQ